MFNKENVDGTITKVNKLWWIKINRKVFRTTLLDGATFPYSLKVKYNVNNICYEKKKIVYWGNEIANIGDRVIVTYNENNPSKILKLTKKK